MEFWPLTYNDRGDVSDISKDTGRKTRKRKKRKSSTLINTFFRNALKSNLDLTALAETKAGILISINGFILTVTVTAASFIAHNNLMTYAFICIILTSLGSIILAILSVKPRSKEHLVTKEHLSEYSSLLYYQDIAGYSPDEYQTKVRDALKSMKKSRKELVNHLHILSSEIKQKYSWLKFAYTFFSLGLILSAALIIYALIDAKNTATPRNTNGYISGKFYNIFEPSGATTVENNKVLIVEDESSTRPLKLVTFDENNHVIEIGDLHIPKKLKKVFKKKVEDLEAIASDGHILYAVTSHAPNRANNDKKERNKLLLMHYEDESIKDISIYKHLKTELIHFKPDIFGERLLGYNPINIEGLAVNPKTHELYIGFRAPLFESKAIVVPVENPHQLFGKQAKKPYFKEPIFIDLDGLGIRGMHFDRLKEGLWIIAGDSGKRISKFQLYFYDFKTKKASVIKKEIELGFSEGITLVNNNGKRLLFTVEDNGIKPNKTADYHILNLDKL